MIIAPDTIKSGLDEIVFQEYEMEKQPGEVRADDTLFFRQKTADWGVVQFAESMGPGSFTEVADDEEVPDATVRVGNKTNVEIKTYERDLPIPQAYQEDSEKYGTVEEWARDMGVRARTTRDKFAFKRSYADAFTGVTTPDAVALISNAHVSLSGDTIDNLETGVANADNVAILIRRLRLMKAQDGDLASYHADGLLCPVKLHPTLVEVTKSELKSGTANNNLNYFSDIYPGLVVGSSEYLDSDYNTYNTNADTSYFAVSKMHKISRHQRIPFATEYIGPEYSKKRIAYLRGRFRERVAAQSWGGVAGSNGTV
jgi:hypothetical protein